MPLKKSTRNSNNTSINTKNQVSKQTISNIEAGKEEKNNKQKDITNHLGDGSF